MSAGFQGSVSVVEPIAQLEGANCCNHKVAGLSHITNIKKDLFMENALLLRMKFIHLLKKTFLHAIVMTVFYHL